MRPRWVDALDARYATGIAAALSALVLLSQVARAHKQLLTRRKSYKPLLADEPLSEEDTDTLKPRRHVQDHGGRTIFAYELLRTLATLNLLGLCAYTTFERGTTRSPGVWALDASVVCARLHSFLACTQIAM
jgi:hypothetical protein